MAVRCFIIVVVIDALNVAGYSCNRKLNSTGHKRQMKVRDMLKQTDMDGLMKECLYDDNNMTVFVIIEYSFFLFLFQY